MITTHQYLGKYPIAIDSEKLLVETIHPHDYQTFKISFFYGSKLSIWTTLNEAFPYELGNPISLLGIIEF